MLNKTAKQLFNRIAALTVIICFVTTSQIYPISEVSPTITQNIPFEHKIEASRADLNQFPQLSIPAEIGSIDQILTQKNNDNKQRVIFHIRDAHGSYEAQVHIKEIIRRLVADYGVKTILLEGGSGVLDPSLFQFFDDQELNGKVTDELAKNGRMSGGELFLVDDINRNDAIGFGAENQAAYNKNLKIFRRVLHGKEKSEQFIKALRRTVEVLGTRTFNNDLRDFMRTWQSWRENRTSLVDYLKAIKKAAIHSLQIDLENSNMQLDYPMLVRYFKAASIESKLDLERIEADRHRLVEYLYRQGARQDILDPIEQWQPNKGLSGWHGELPRNYLEKLYLAYESAGFRFDNYPSMVMAWAYLIFQSELDGLKLFEEIDRINNVLFDRLSESREEKELIETIKDSILLENLLHLELTRDEVMKAKQKRDEISPVMLAERLYKNYRGVHINIVNMKKVMDAYNLSFLFYEGAVQREKYLVENCERIMKENSDTKAIMITGGFHSDGLRETWKDKNYAYVEISPKITSVDDIRKVYLDVMLEGRQANLDQSQISTPLLTDQAEKLGTAAILELMKVILKATNGNLDLLNKRRDGTAISNVQFRIIDYKRPAGADSKGAEVESQAKPHLMIVVDGIPVALFRIVNSENGSLAVDEGNAILLAGETNLNGVLLGILNNLSTEKPDTARQKSKMTKEAAISAKDGISLDGFIRNADRDRSEAGVSLAGRNELRRISPKDLLQAKSPTPVAVSANVATTSSGQAAQKNDIASEKLKRTGEDILKLKKGAAIDLEGKKTIGYWRNVVLTGLTIPLFLVVAGDVFASEWMVSSGLSKLVVTGLGFTITLCISILTARYVEAYRSAARQIDNKDKELLLNVLEGGQLRSKQENKAELRQPIEPFRTDVVPPVYEVAGRPGTRHVGYGGAQTAFGERGKRNKKEEPKTVSDTDIVSLTPEGIKASRALKASRERGELRRLNSPSTPAAKPPGRMDEVAAAVVTRQAEDVFRVGSRLGHVFEISNAIAAESETARITETQDLVAFIGSKDFAKIIKTDIFSSNKTTETLADVGIPADSIHASFSILRSLGRADFPNVRFLGFADSLIKLLKFLMNQNLQRAHDMSAELVATLQSLLKNQERKKRARIDAIHDPNLAQAKKDDRGFAVMTETEGIIEKLGKIDLVVYTDAKGLERGDEELEAVLPFIVKAVARITSAVKGKSGAERAALMGEYITETMGAFGISYDSESGNISILLNKFILNLKTQMLESKKIGSAA